MATQKKQKVSEDSLVVTNLGDVTESNAPQVLLGDLIFVRPLAELPQAYAVLATRHPSAKGFTEEGTSIALHF